MKMLVLFFLFLINQAAAQPYTEEKDLHPEWMKFENGRYEVIHGNKDQPQNTVYIKFETNHFPSGYLSISSAKRFFIFFNGRLSGEYQGITKFNLDSLSGKLYTTSILVTIHQDGINPKDLKTSILSIEKNAGGSETLLRPKSYFKDFVIVSGLILIVLFVVTMQINPKLAADYFSIVKIFSLREGDDAQANARLTSSSNIQFFVICSLLLGFYMMIIIYHLPDEYSLPLYFPVHSFWTVVWQWIRLSLLILGTFVIKMLLIYSLTRLFGLQGLARIHFFNWVRLMFIVFGGSSVILFVYFIWRGQSQEFFVLFLSLVIATLTGWVFVVYLKLNSKSEHSMFHLFSYICATEIIPLLITIKVLFQ